MSGYYVANIFAKNLGCQFLYGKEKSPIRNICLCGLLVTYMWHMRLSALSPGFVPVLRLLKQNACLNTKGYLFYHSHEQSYLL